MTLLESGGIDLGPLLPHQPAEIIVGIVLMVIVYLILRAKVVPAFEKIYSERAEAIQGGMERAEKAQAEAQAALEDYRTQLAAAREEAAQIREQAKAQGAQVLSEMRDQAQHESNRMLAQARAQIEAERQQVMNQLRSEIGGMATTLAGKIVGESLSDDARARATVDRFLADMETQSTAGVGVTR